MPKNSSARRRRRARAIAADEHIKYTQALRRSDEAVSRADDLDPKSPLRPPKLTVDGIEKYMRLPDAEHLGQDELGDPTYDDLTTAADKLAAALRTIRSIKLTPATILIPPEQRNRLGHTEAHEQFRATIDEIHQHLDRVRADTDSGYIDWMTVAAAVYGVNNSLNTLPRITAGRLRDRIEAATELSGTLAMTAEAVHSRGCLLGFDRSRRLHGGYSPCDTDPVRVRVRIFDDEVTVTVPGCARHAAEEIVLCDYDVEEGWTRVEIMAGTTADLDRIYHLADQVRGERENTRRARERHEPGSWTVPTPPWRHHRDHW